MDPIVEIVSENDQPQRWGFGFGQLYMLLAVIFGAVGGVRALYGIFSALFNGSWPILAMGMVHLAFSSLCFLSAFGIWRMRKWGLWSVFVVQGWFLLSNSIIPFFANPTFSPLFAAILPTLWITYFYRRRQWFY